MSTAPTLRLHLFHARDCTRTVILRQGPHKLCRMILWDRDGDRFHDGQWLKHKVYADRCDLSPDGKHFLYFALDGQWSGPSNGSYTVISQPPYFTGLGLFPEESHYGGGGYFIDSKRFYVNAAPSAPDLIGQASGLQRLFSVAASASNPLGLEDEAGKPLRLDAATAAWLAAGRPSSVAGGFEVEGARLYRLQGGVRHLVRDFTDMAFEPILAPYAAPYAAPETWHPLDGEHQ